MFYERLKDLCEQKGVSLTNVVKELGMSTGNMSKWKSGMIPKSDTINALSEYFGVTTDYLTGRSNDMGNQTLTLTAKEINLILKYRSLDAEGQTMVESALITELRRLAAEKGESVSAG